jgi:DNA-binding NarL/FixJ family response regulator
VGRNAVLEAGPGGGSVSPVGVLIVDDQEPFRRAAAAVVSSTDGFVMVGAVGSGEESVGAVLASSPDLVLMDVRLPGIDGMEATRRIRALPSPPLVVLVSTYDRAEFGDEVARCGAGGYVTKSAFDADALSRLWDRAHGRVQWDLDA